MTMVRVLWVFFRLGVLNELQYRVNFVVQLFQSLLGLATSLATLAVVFAQTSAVNGWRSPELLAVLGTYFLVGGAIRLVIQPSMQQLMEDVRQGTLDFTLTKPQDAQLLVSIRQVQVWKLVDVAMGLGVVIVALVQMQATIGPWQALSFLVALLCGGAIVYSFLLALTTCAFWFVRVENILVIFESVYEAGRWPVGIYPGWLRLMLTFIVPVAFAITVPAEAMTGRLTWPVLLGAVALAVAMLVGSRLFWRLGVRRYSGASS
jgi:ABC-2 type transport system permease protein